MNNLDPEVAENPHELVVYGGIGRAARTWQDFDRIVATLKTLDDDETLLVQSGKPVGVFRTHADAPRVLIANSNLVPHWATWDHFNELDRKGLAMYGQMTAGSWIYIGTQGIVQGTYETFVEAGRQHYGGDLKGRWILTAGLGGMGGAQPLAAVMAGACCLAVECNPASIDFRLRTRYLDARAESLDEALAMIDAWTRAGEAKSVGPARQRRRSFARTGAARASGRTWSPTRLRRTIRSMAICPKGGRWPSGGSKRQSDPKAVETGGPRVHARARGGDARLLATRGCRRSTTATTSGRSPRTQGCKTPSRFPASSRLTSARCFAGASARSAGWRSRATRKTSTARTRRSRSCCPATPHLHHWLDMARERIAFQGLPARICWVGLGDRHRLGLAFNEMVASGELKAPVVIGRDHLDSGSVASPNRETEAMRDGSDAVSDWPLLNALLNTASGATWVSLHHGGGVGMGFSQHAGMVICCDGTADAARRIGRVLWNDPATGVMRHADAGLRDRARLCAGTGVSICPASSLDPDGGLACVAVPASFGRWAGSLGEGQTPPTNTRPPRDPARPDAGPNQPPEVYWEMICPVLNT